MISLLPEYGVGIELTMRSLKAVVAKTLWGKVQVLDKLEIDDLANRSAAECGELYRAFLKRNSLESPWTVVAIPRDAFVYRERKLPANVIDELQSVMAMQVDTLHPFGDEEIVWDSVAAKNSGSGTAHLSPSEPQRVVTVSAAIARWATIETLAEWFDARGIPVSQFAASPILLRSIATSAMTNGGAAASPVAAAYARDTSWELVGISPSGTSSTRVLDLESTDAAESYRKLTSEIERVLAELRLDQAAQPIVFVGGETGRIHEATAALKAAAGLRIDVKELPPQALAEAAARTSFERTRASALNLLPENRRRFIPSMSLAPTYALAAIVLLLCIALGVRGNVQDWLYGQRLQAEIRSLQPRITEIEAIRGRERQTYNRILKLASIRNEAKVPLEVLEDLTQALPKDAWLQGLQMDGNALTIAGSAASASGVLQAISQAKTLESPQFLSAIARSNTGEESFRIGAKLRVGMR